LSDIETSASTAAETAREALQGILDRMGIECTVSAHVDGEGQITLDVSSDSDLGTVIGRDGDTLNALQLLVSVIVSRRHGPHSRVVVDAENYRARRAESLQARAIELAQRVKATGREALLESLHAYERRIIHLTLADHPDVYTYSEGEGDARVLVISPRD